MNIQGQSILILGLGREGASLAKFLTGRGAKVTVTDTAPPTSLAPAIRIAGDQVSFVLGGHHPDLVRGIDAFFVSPGVPETNPVYAEALSAGIDIQSMTTLFFDLCPGIILGVTGSSGKTTTTSLIGHILRSSRRDVQVGGNIGAPMLDLLPAIRAETIVVLELSSFQLGILRRSPHISVVANITPNHLDRHGTMERYIAAKRNVVAYQGADDYVVVNADDPASMDFAARTPGHVRRFSLQPRIADGASLQNDWLGLNRERDFTPVLPVEDVSLLGRHNVENVLAALAATDILDVEPKLSAEAIRTYRPAPHRLQTVATHMGVRYIDDSVATSPARTAVALKALDGPILLIAGGRDKNLPWDDLARMVASRVRGLFLIGEAASTIEQAVRRHLSSGLQGLQPEAVRSCGSLTQAVVEATGASRAGDVVLLSPACASYDMFSNYEERGDAFARAVEELPCAAA